MEESSVPMMRRDWITEAELLDRAGHLSGDENPFSLSRSQIERILAVPRLELNAPPGLSIPPDVNYNLAGLAIAIFCAELHSAGVQVPRGRATDLEHVEGIAADLKSLLNRLKSERTPRELRRAYICAAEPIREFAAELDFQLSNARDRSDADKVRRDEGRGSHLELFIRVDLARCFESVYGRPARVSRRADQQPDGPFVRFAAQFLQELQVPATLETIASAMRPPRRKARTAVKSRRMGRTRASADLRPTT
jgi:hypothetical protein